MGKLISTILLFFLLAPGVYAQVEITWEALADVTFTDKYYEEEDAYFYFPEFGKKLKELDGKEVVLKGYMLILGANQDVYILSRNTFASCFFCGGSGPESIVELKLKPGHPKYTMDQLVTIKGKFKLNKEDIYQCNYIFEEAEPYEVY
jgi:hypothetical protein